MSRHLFCAWFAFLSATSCSQEKPVEREIVIHETPLPDGMIAMVLRIHPEIAGNYTSLISHEVRIYSPLRQPEDAPKTIVDRTRVIAVALDNNGKLIMTFAVTPAQARKLIDAVDAGERLTPVLLPPNKP